MRPPWTVACLALLGSLAAAPAAARAEAKLEVSNHKPRPGDPVLVTVTGVDRAPRGTGGKVPLIFFPVQKGWQALFAIPLDDTPPELKVTLSEPALSETLTVVTRTWAEEKVKVDPEMAEPPADKRKLIDGDNGAIITALKDHGPPRFQAGFTKPSGGSVSSTFGAWRTLNGGYRSRHLGLDFAVRMATPVRAIQDGEVALVRSGFLTGGTVVVTHGIGVASTYFHLDDIKVAVGDIIKRGAVIGKVGMTGRTTGPHIHIGVWVPGGFIDPDAFFRLRVGPMAAPAKPAAAAAPAKPGAPAKPAVPAK
jgi:murein DD-endopeptidase MepM/ murein hydrolase activator NlpD